MPHKSHTKQVMTVRKQLILSVFLSLLSLNTYAQSDATDATEKYFDTIKSNPAQLSIFLRHMPKGGDLHNHLGGASMAENLIAYAKDDDLCLDMNTFAVAKNPSCLPEDRLDNIQPNSKMYHVLVDQWSMRDFKPTKESGHDHFFNIFGKYGAISGNHTGQMLTEVVKRAGAQNEIYLELMVTPDRNASGLLGKRIGWNTDMEQLRQTLLANGLPAIVKDISKNLDNDITYMNNTLACSTNHPDAGCNVKVRFLYQVLREQPPEQVFAQLLAGFEAASKDTRIVGINMVQPEDGKISMQDYDLQMHIVNFLHKLYPQVSISLHAGELVPGLVSNDGLRFHINEAVTIAGAKRIGHGVDIRYEDNMEKLLQQMAANHTMVEINLTSNQDILNVSGDVHPILTYMQYHVPVALSTDDEGIERTNLTSQYQKAELNYHFSYTTLKTFVRNSINYSFVPGNYLWMDDDYQKVTPVCATDNFASSKISAACQDFLNKNEKANLQWELEKRFAAFEGQF